MTVSRSAPLRPGDDAVRGPLAAASVSLETWAGQDGVHLLYADLDLMEVAALRRALGLPATGAETDADLVLAAVRRWGAEAADRLGGAFAFAVWDGRQQAVVAHRDPVGLRPLVYAHRPGWIVLGGDVRAVLTDPAVPDALDEDMLAAVFLDPLFQPETVGRTALRAVACLKGGHRLTVDADGAREDRTWSPEAFPRLPFRRVEEIGEALRAVLREVTAEAIADAPPGTVGTHLSSGIDSSAVTAFAAEALAERGLASPTAYSWLPAPVGPPEVDQAAVAATAERWGLTLVWAPPTADDILATLTGDATREPNVMRAPNAATLREAEVRGTRLLLSGWGGDEAASFSGRRLVTPHLLRTGRWGPVAERALRDPVEVLRRLRTYRAARRVSGPEPSFDALREGALRGEQDTFARVEWLRQATFPTLAPPPSDPHGYAAWLLRRGHLGARAGSWALTGAEVGIRTRYPLLDRRVLAVALGVPAEAWATRDRLRRRPFREALAGLVPDAVRLGGKREPSWNATLLRAQVDALRRVGPMLTPAAVADRATFVDVDRLRAAVRALPVAPTPWEVVSLDGIRYLGIGALLRR